MNLEHHEVSKNVWKSLIFYQKKITFFVSKSLVKFVSTTWDWTFNSKFLVYFYKKIDEKNSKFSKYLTQKFHLPEGQSEFQTWRNFLKNCKFSSQKFAQWCFFPHPISSKVRFPRPQIGIFYVPILLFDIRKNRGISIKLIQKGLVLMFWFQNHQGLCYRSSLIWKSSSPWKKLDSCQKHL